jgi:hypothetical protein
VIWIAQKLLIRQKLCLPTHKKHYTETGMNQTFKNDYIAFGMFSQINEVVEEEVLI